jgi:cyclic beta-1,2-glucan synthetase
MLRAFVHAYQRVQPLTIGELWAVAITLRVVLVENLGAWPRASSRRAARQEADAWRRAARRRRRRAVRRTARASRA